MIKLLFEYLGERVIINIDGKKLWFGTASFGNQYVPIDGLRLDYNGVCREFPDLETKKDWREQAINRFKKNISKMKNEEEIEKYLINDLKKVGYKFISKQKSGFRTQKQKHGK